MVGLIQNWTFQNRFDRDYLPEIEDKLYFHGDTALRKLTNYTVVLLLATVIATYGVTGDSTATVIGAMLVAPLMTPIMGATLALTAGNGPQALRSLTMVALSVLAVILLSGLLSLPLTFVDFSGNSEITSRVQPGLSALIVALAAGAVGAFATSRREIGDTMPGVAIAISLVPPLSVVGISLAHGRADEAAGALLLFITNFLAILLAGGFVFRLSGAGELQLSATQASLRSRGFLIAGISAIVVTVLLGLTSYQVYTAQRQYVAGATAVETWLAPTDYSMVTLNVHYPQVGVVVTGSGELGTAESLARQLEAAGLPNARVQITRMIGERDAFPLP